MNKRFEIQTDRIGCRHYRHWILDKTSGILMPIGTKKQAQEFVDVLNKLNDALALVDLQLPRKLDTYDPDRRGVVAFTDEVVLRIKQALNSIK